jgi:hypothetical protein
MDCHPERSRRTSPTCLKGTDFEDRSTALGMMNCCEECQAASNRALIVAAELSERMAIEVNRRYQSGVEPHEFHCHENAPLLQKHAGVNRHAASP